MNGRLIHRFRLHGTNIVADTNSGSVHVFDDIAYAALGMLEEAAGMHAADKQGDNSAEISDMLSSIEERLAAYFGDEAAREAIDEIGVLIKDGLLFSEDEYDGLKAFNGREPVVKALCLHVSHDCNMRCGYCFASAGSFGGERTSMPPGTARKAVDFLIRESGARRNLEVDFFGGEPLLNFEAVKDTVAYARSLEKKAGKSFKFTITTNALTLKKEHIDYINEHMDNIVLSIDGRRETNDRMRTCIDGSGTYERILPAIREMVHARKERDHYIRGTFTRQNLDFSEDVLHLADLGFSRISVEPVVAPDGSGYEIRKDDIPAVCGQYEKLALEYVKRKNEKRGFDFFHFMIDFSQGPCVIKRLGGCGSGCEYLAVTPAGDIYPCHQFVGMEGFRMGSVFEGVLDKHIRKAFLDCSIYSRRECRECWARFYCSGGCAANAYLYGGDLNKPYTIGCELERKRVECALWIKSQENRQPEM